MQVLADSSIENELSNHVRQDTDFVAAGRENCEPTRSGGPVQPLTSVEACLPVMRIIAQIQESIEAQQLSQEESELSVTQVAAVLAAPPVARGESVILTVSASQ